MALKSTRREFLKHAACASGAGLVGAYSNGIAQAIEPIARDGKCFFKFSLAAYSYRDLLNAKPPAPRFTWTTSSPTAPR